MNSGPLLDALVRAVCVDNRKAVAHVAVRPRGKSCPRVIARQTATPDAHPKPEVGVSIRRCIRPCPKLMALAISLASLAGLTRLINYCMTRSSIIQAHSSAEGKYPRDVACSGDSELGAHAGCVLRLEQEKGTRSALAFIPSGNLCADATTPKRLCAPG